MHLLTSFPGWTWEYIDACMTIPRLRAINHYQSDHLPIALGVEHLVNGFLERKP